MLCWRRISAIGTPASPCFRISTIWLSVNRDFRMGISLAPESLRSKCLLKGEAYVDVPRLLVVAVAWNQVHCLLSVRIGHEFRVKSCRPIQVGLLWPDDDDTAVEHRSPPEIPEVVASAAEHSRGDCAAESW